jgi:hypothetical protein
MAGAEVYVGGQREAELSAWFAARL